MTQKYHFVHVTLKGNKGAVIALVYMYFGHIDNIKIKEIILNMALLVVDFQDMYKYHLQKNLMLLYKNHSF